MVQKRSKSARSVNFQFISRKMCTRLGQRPGSQTVTSFFRKTNQSHDGTFHPDFCVSAAGRADIRLFRRTKDTEISWGCGHIHWCHCLRFRKPATARFLSKINNSTSSHSDNASLFSVSVRSSSFSSASSCRRFFWIVKDNVLPDNVLLLRCLERGMVGVGGISILQLLQNTNDLAEACVNCNHFDIQSRRGDIIGPPFRGSWSCRLSALV